MRYDIYIYICVIRRLKVKALSFAYLHLFTFFLMGISFLIYVFFIHDRFFKHLTRVHNKFCVYRNMEITVKWPNL